MVLWTQGCTINCPGCFNPKTHPIRGGREWLIGDLLALMISLQGQIEGITISGGEPLLQIKALSQLLREVRSRTTLSVILFSGFTWEEIQAMPHAKALLTQVDILLAGRYQQNKHLATGLRGSSNKTVHYLSSRYPPSVLSVTPPAEVFIATDGTVTFSGIDPLRP